MRLPVLIVGAGFAGATYARVLADRGWEVHVIDKRPHIGGNAYDEVGSGGVRIHRYGPHLFHTNNPTVAHWLSRFTAFVPFEHRAEALLADGRVVPVPINRKTIAAVFNVDLATQDEARRFLARQIDPIESPRNAEEYLHGTIGRILTDVFCRPYVRKMWGMELAQLDASVMKRFPVRTDDEDRYFAGDRFQMLPAAGYATMFEAMLDHPRIRVVIGQPFDKVMLRHYCFCFNSMPIDEYFDFILGPLPYRSMRFHHQEVGGPGDPERLAVTVLTHHDKFVRRTDWAKLPGHLVKKGTTRTVTSEEPCDHIDNDLERYYPVRTSDGANDRIYRRYAALARHERNIVFIGRCGTYRYLDMHQVVNQGLLGAARWCALQGSH